MRRAVGPETTILSVMNGIDSEERILQDFSLANDLFHQCRAEFPDLAESMTTRSWGMSDDYPLAIQQGSTLVRIGSSIFGARQY
jgi:uncharacterized pyridoxal phosphate-containing UPF0001 family protein